MGQAIAILLCILPTVWEIWNDRNGESKKDKTKDLLIAVILYAVASLINWKAFEIHPLKSIALMIGVRVAFFDYIIQYILIKRDIIVGKWWNYHGKTARFDRLIARIDWRIVMAVRAVLFVISVYAFHSVAS